MSIFKLPFGILPDGQQAHLYVMRNQNGFQVSVTDFGSTLVSILAPDRNGLFHNVVLGYESVNEYAQADGYLGATVGRFANRLAKCTFTIDGQRYEGLCANDGENSIHGGKIGYSHRMWEATVADNGNEPVLKMHLLSPDGEENYPGTVDVTVAFTVTADNALSIHYTAVTDKPTVVSLTNHTYFNLGGASSGNVFNQILFLDAESYLRGDSGLIPIGEIVPVENTPFDFRKPKPLGRDFFTDNNDLRLAGGYDHCFNFTGWEHEDGEIKVRGIAHDPQSGRTMTMLTNSPCVQLYTANFLNNQKYPLAGGQAQQTQHAFCLETQKMPDSPNHEGFTNAVLRPGEVWDYTTVYQFSVN